MKKENLSKDHKLVLLVLAGAILLASLGISIATVALPTLVKVFSVELSQVQWVILAYLLAVTTAIVLAGRLADLYGNRRVLIAGLVLFASASVASIWAPDLVWLIVARAVQGLGAAILMALPMSMAKNLVAKERLGTAMGLLGTMSAIGTAAGPSLGGVLIGAFGWRAAFVVLALCSLGLLALAVSCLPQTKASARAARIDWAGYFWLSVMLLCFALLTTGARVGDFAPSWLLLALGFAACWAFIRTELACAHPLVPVVLIRGRAVASSLAINLLVGAIMMSTLVVGPFFLSFGLGLSEAQTGLVMAVGPLAAAISGVPAGRLTDRYGANKTLLIGLLLATAGLLCFALLPTFIKAPGYVLALLLLTPGFQLFLAANSTAMMSGVVDEHRGLLSGLLGLSRNLGFMTGAAMLPLLFITMLGAQGLAGSSLQAISTAFSITFLSATGLCILAIVMALYGMASGRAQAFLCWPRHRKP